MGVDYRFVILNSYDFIFNHHVNMRINLSPFLSMHAAFGEKKTRPKIDIILLIKIVQHI